MVLHDDAWKTQLKADVGRIEAFFDRIRKDVATHNVAVSKTLRGMRSELGSAVLPLRTPKPP